MPRPDKCVTRKGTEALGARLLIMLLWGAGAGCGFVAPNEWFPDPGGEGTIHPAGEVSGGDAESPGAEPQTDPPPALRVLAAPVFCCNPLTVSFGAELAGIDPTLPVAVYWDFGDGRTGRGRSVQHTYAFAGEYMVRAGAMVTGGVDVSGTGTLALVRHGDGSVDLHFDRPQVDGDGDSTGGEDPGSNDSGGPTGGVDPVSPFPPVTAVSLAVNAGIDQTTQGGVVVRLAGRVVISPAHAAVAVHWRQLNGPTVALSDSNVTMPTFVSPPAADTTLELSFEFSAVSGDQTARDVMHVYVRPKSTLTYERFPGARVEFLTVPNASAVGLQAVTWRMAGDAAATNVHLVQGCCSCRDTAVAATGPDPTGAFRSQIHVNGEVTSWIQVAYEIAGIAFRSQAYYLHVPGGQPGAAEPPVLWYHGRWVQQQSLRDALAPGVITHVLIDGGDRARYAAAAPEVQEVVAICRHAGVQVIWCRHLWNTEMDLQSIDDVFDPAFYEGAVSQVLAEAEALGADGSALDCEAYDPTLVDGFLAQDLPDADHDAMSAAISTAAASGRVDFVFPTGWHGRRRAPEHLYQGLGWHGVSESTYYDYPAKNCRITYPYEIFGAYVAGWTERPEEGPVPHFLPQDILARRYLWSAADGAPPGVNGLFLYAGPNQVHVTAAARMLRDAFISQP